MIQKGWSQPRVRFAANAYHSWLLQQIPVLYRGLRVSLKEVDGGQKFVRVRIGGIKFQSTLQISYAFALSLLFEGDPGQLQRKALVPRSQRDR
jgi:hypothetical protein